MSLPVRRLEIISEHGARLELARLGLEPSGIRSMIPKQFHYNLKVAGLPPALAGELARQAERAGVEAAFGPDVVADGGVSAILSGTLGGLRALSRGLGAGDVSTAGLAAGMATALEASFHGRGRLKGRTREWAFGERTLVMGILNVTPDSFYDGGSFAEKGAAVDRALKMHEEGADLIDVGGESTRPGAEPVDTAEELERVVPVVETLASRGLAVSVDTTKAAVARAALEAGAEMVNDVSALERDPEMAGVCAEYGAAVVLMHMRGTPRTMQDDVEYADLAGEVFAYLASRLEFASERGIGPERTVIDPGIGFGKSAAGNLELLSRTSGFKSLGRPVLIGASRKSFIEKLTGPGDRLPGTLAVSAAAVMAGASVLRVHDVEETVRAVRIIDALKGAGNG